MLKTLVRKFVEQRGYVFERADPATYDEDGLRTVHNHDFLTDPQFKGAYQRGVRAAGDLRWRWRCHIGLWAASTASRLDGDFVECGVNRGFLSSAIMQHLDWDSLGKTFWLLDTFDGIDMGVLPEDEQEHVVRRDQILPEGFYVSGVARVRENFAEWRNVRLVVGAVPTTLSEVTADRVSYLHLDMNTAAPEVAALEFFWPRLTPGAVVLMDDYGYRGFELQHEALSGFAREHNVAIASLPTGQGLLLR
jgi:hypothetical protein